MKRGVIVGMVVIEVITIFLIYFIFFHPITALIGSYDYDGDGYPNSSDEFPQDPENWVTLSATLYITLENSNQVSPINYELKVNDGRPNSYENSWIQEGSSINCTCMFTFAAGVRKGADTTIIATSYIDGEVMKTDTWVGYVSNNEMKYVTLVI
jgi:hypothetical protein